MALENSIPFRLFRKANFNTVITLTIGLVCFLLSTAIPSFMSPDEFDHIKRAYWLSQGTFILKGAPGKVSGDMVDTGLMDYINFYTSKYVSDRNHKFSIDEKNEASKIKWSDNEVFSAAPGTGYYFPAIYAPQALALWSGKLLGLTIDQSYRLARAMALAAATLLLIIAFELHRPPPLAIALIMLPMTLFQLASASLDGVSNALAIFVISLFLKICSEKENPQQASSCILGLSLFILVSSRAHLLPMLVLPFFAYFLSNKTRNLLIIGIAATVATISWLIIAIIHTVDTRVITGAPTSTIALYYIMDPSAFLSVLYHTLNTPGRLYNLGITFMGALGWLDTVFSPIVYVTLSLLLGLCTLVTLLTSNIRKSGAFSLILGICALCSVLMTYFSLLITWNPHPATTIEGIQGRYFFAPAILLAYALSPHQTDRPRFFRIAAPPLLTLLLIYSSYATMSLLIYKYYMH